MTRLLLAAGLLAAQGMAQVVINEFQYDDAGTDDFEFVELYNSGPAVDISGWSIVNRDAGSPLYGGVGVDPTQVIPSGTILLNGAYYVIGNAAVPNVNQIAASGMLENDNESIELRDAGGNLIDSVCYEMGLGAFGVAPLTFPQEGNGFFGDLATGNATASIGRIVDGLDTNRNSVDFACTSVPTPGATNGQPNVLPYTENFDAGGYLANVTGWNPGFVFGRHVDPTIVDAHNLIAKPPSPQGGQALSLWDNTGGGNSLQMVNVATADVVLECYAWIDAPMTLINPVFGPTYTAAGVGSVLGQNDFNDGEYWVMGVRGSTTANANPPDVPGTYYQNIRLGVGALRPQHLTGIAWVYYRTAGGNPTTSTTNPTAQLFLVDFKDGAQASPTAPATLPPYTPPALQNFTILGGPINITAGVNDGWQRLRIHAQGTDVIGNFGGTPGLDNGTRFSGKTTTGAGMIYVGYREAILLNSNCHPPLFDALDIHVPTTSKAPLGTGSPLANNTIPVLDTDGLPILGSTGFRLNGSGLVPNGFAYLVLGINLIPGGFQVPGAPLGANIYMFPFDFEFYQFPNGAGQTSQLLPVPNDTNLLGLPFAAELACFDFALGAYSLPIAVAQPLLMTIGH